MHKQKLEAAARRELAVLERGVSVIRDNDGKPTALTANGLRLVEMLAKAGGGKGYIAAKLKLSQSNFKKLLGNGVDENDARMHYERGHALHEQDVANRLLAEGAPAASLVFYAKSRLHWKEEPAPEIRNNILITLPRAPTREEYYKSLGIDGPVDTRTMKNITPTPKQIPQDQPLYSQPTTGDKHHD